MHRLLAALVVLALAAPAQAGAKGLISLSVCGTNACHTTRAPQELSDAQDSAPQADPGRTGAFFTLRQTIGEPGMNLPLTRERSEWFPALRVVRGTDGPLAGWTLPTPATEQVLRRLSRGLRPFPADQLPRAPGDAQAAQIAESVGYPRLNPPQESQRGGFAWAWLLLAVLPAAALFAVRRRSRWH